MLTSLNSIHISGTGSESNWLEKIASFVFDTTALNAGLKNGIVVKTGTRFCKVWAAARMQTSYFWAGSWGSLLCYLRRKNESCARSFQETHYKLVCCGQNQLDPTVLPTSMRLLASLVEKAIAFLPQWISTNVEQHLTHDYQELAVTTLRFLDTAKANTNIVAKAPGAIHNARWYGAPFV